MTQHYYFVRREIYELKKSKKYRKNRTFSEMKKLFTPLYWLIIILNILCMVAVLVFLIISFLVKVNLLWIFIPLLLMFASIIFRESVSEQHWYKTDGRKNEIKEEKKSLKEFLDAVEDIFRDNKIDNKGIILLKRECEERVNKSKNKFGLFQNRTIDIFIIAPVVAILTLLVDASQQPNINAIVTILYFGFVFLCITKAFLPLQGILNSTHKDQCLLEAINDLEYKEHFNVQE